MPRTVTQVDVLHDYVSGVMDRADHHAGNVADICLAIAGGVIWRNDGDIRVYERQGQMTNALWFEVNGRSYAVSYNHIANEIEIRQDNLKGQTVASFSNTNTAADVRRFFEGL